MNRSTKRNRIDAAVKAEAPAARKLSHTIHEFAERPFRETRSANVLAEYLETRGFRVEFPFKKIPTAFRATWGSGKPAIGVLGEYDALPNCGAEGGSWGHG
jgi:aminobenzoyl-glutamate utilization protein B